MCRLLPLIIWLAAGSVLLPRTAHADAVEDAYRLCAAFEATGMTTEREVKRWGSTVDVRIDTNGSEARSICSGAADMMAELTRSFAGRWKLRIFSPYSGDHPIAICNLR